MSFINFYERSNKRNLKAAFGTNLAEVKQRSEEVDAETKRNEMEEKCSNYATTKRGRKQKMKTFHSKRFFDSGADNAIERDVYTKVHTNV